MTAHDLATAATQWHAAKRAERDAMAVLYAAIRVAVAGGLSQSETARVAGVDRMTVRRALGLRS